MRLWDIINETMVKSFMKGCIYLKKRVNTKKKRGKWTVSEIDYDINKCFPNLAQSKENKNSPFMKITKRRNKRESKGSTKVKFKWNLRSSILPIWGSKALNRKEEELGTRLIKSKLIICLKYLEKLIHYRIRTWCMDLLCKGDKWGMFTICI